jgi:predicted naringenin-chalcone synthase
LGVRAAREAIELWGGSARSITHLVWGTSTGSIHAPTMDVHLALVLGLRENVERLNIESMGCATGFRCLGVANDIAQSSSNNVILVVCCDIRSSLTNQLPRHTPRAPFDHGDILASALFRDGGGAAIVSSAERCGPLPQMSEGALVPSINGTGVNNSSGTSNINNNNSRVPDSPSMYAPPSPSLLTPISTSNSNDNLFQNTHHNTHNTTPHSHSSHTPLYTSGSSSSTPTHPPIPLHPHAPHQHHHIPALNRVLSNSPSITAMPSPQSHPPPLLAINSYSLSGNGSSHRTAQSSPYARQMQLPASAASSSSSIATSSPATSPVAAATPSPLTILSSPSVSSSIPHVEGGAWYEILSHQSVLIPNTYSLYSFAEGDDTVMHLSMDKEMPHAIERAVAPAVADLLRPFGITADQCCFAIHTAGPKVMAGIARALGIRKERMASSWHTMMRYGDLSGASNLVCI